MNITASLRRWSRADTERDEAQRRGLTRRVRNAARDWARRRQGVDPRSIRVDRRRVYILPTRSGMLFGTVTTVLLLGSMNYSNSMGFVLTFLLASIALVAMHHCHRNLLDLQVDFHSVAPVFAGQAARFRFLIGNHRDVPRWQICIGWDRDAEVCVQTGARMNLPVEVPIDTQTRGWLKAPRLCVSTSYPLGLFRAWTWVHMDLAALVYPRPATSVPNHGGTPDGLETDGSRQQGEDEFSGLREFRRGDSPRRIAWKSYAREGTLLVKEFLDGGHAPQWIDWDRVAGNDTEQRLANMCRLVLDAHRDGGCYGLRLPSTVLAPENGHAHLHRCMRELAIFRLQPVQHQDTGRVEMR